MTVTMLTEVLMSIGNVICLVIGFIGAGLAFYAVFQWLFYKTLDHLGFWNDFINYILFNKEIARRMNEWKKFLEHREEFYEMLQLKEKK